MKTTVMSSPTNPRRYYLYSDPLIDAEGNLANRFTLADELSSVEMECVKVSSPEYFTDAGVMVHYCWCFALNMADDTNGPAHILEKWNSILRERHLF